MKTDPIHIGALIEERITEIGITKAEFARRIDTSRQNVNTILRKESMDVGLIIVASRVLNCDFLGYYSRQLAPYRDPPPEPSAPIVSLHLNVAELRRVLGEK